MNENLKKIHEYLIGRGNKEEDVLEFDKYSVYLSMEIMEYAHRNQTRENGEEYANHPSRVMQSYRDMVGITPHDPFCIDSDLLFDNGIPYEGVQEVALLHDVIEDTEFTIEDVRQIFIDCDLGSFFDMYIKIPLEFITHDKSMPYDDYIDICLKNRTSALVKMLDLQDNLHVIDLIKFDEKNFKRSANYLGYIYLINSCYHFIENAEKYHQKFKENNI